MSEASPFPKSITPASHSASRIPQSPKPKTPNPPPQTPNPKPKNKKKIVRFGFLSLFFSPFFYHPIGLPVRAAGGPTVITLSGQLISESVLAVADFNHDGRKEIVAGGIDGRLYVIDGATHTVMWEKQMADYFSQAINQSYCPTTIDVSGVTSTDIRAGITIGDLNRDGNLEIVVATGGGAWRHYVGAIVVLTYVGGSSPFTLVPGWPRLACDELGHPDNYSRPDGVPDGFLSTPAVGDLDGDGDLEIVIGGLDRRLHAWHHDGTILAGWPIDRSRNYWRDTISTPALADIDRDGLPEVIIGTNDYLIPACPNPYLLYAINGDGSFLSGFPVITFQNITSSPAIGDIDGDGWLDIVVGTGNFNETCVWSEWVFVPQGNKVHAWDHTGNPLPGWPTTTAGNMTASPALGDLDGDGDLEVVAGCSDYLDFSCTLLYAWHGDGTTLSGFPVSPTSTPIQYYHSPILADYDGDGAVEIMVVAQGTRTITIVEPDGTVNPDTSRTTNGYLDNTPLVDDIDSDGRLETLIGSTDASGHGAISIWSETGSVYSHRPWPMFHHDVARTGLYSSPPAPPQLGFPDQLRFLHQQGSGDSQTMPVTIQNLGIGQFDWQIANPNIPNLQIGPGSGTVSSSATVQLTLTTTGYISYTWHYLGDLTVSGTAYGQPVLSSPRTVPVWLYIGDIDQIHLPIIKR